MVRLLLLLASLVAFAASCVLAGMDAAVAVAALRSDGRLERQHQALLQDLNTDNLSVLTNTAEVINILQDIARRSTQDMRWLTGLVKQKRQDDERRLKEEVERLQAEQPLLRQRWRRAKRDLKENRKKTKAAAQFSLQHVQALASETLATLQEVEHLDGLQHRLERLTQQVLARRRQDSWWQSFWARWWARLAWLVRYCNSVTWYTSRQGRDDSPHPRQDAPEDTDTDHEDSVDLQSDAEQSPWQDAVTADDETGEVTMTDAAVNDEGDTNEEAAIVQRPETVAIDAEEDPGVADSYVTSELESQDSKQEGDGSGKRANDEAATPSHSTPGGVPPSHIDNSDAAPRSQELPRRRWMVCSFAVLSYVFFALRIYARFCRRHNRRRHKVH